MPSSPHSALKRADLLHSGHAIRGPVDPFQRKVRGIPTSARMPAGRLFRGMATKGLDQSRMVPWEPLRTPVTARLPSIFALNPVWNRSRETATHRRAAALYKSAVSHPLARALPSEARRVPTATSESWFDLSRGHVSGCRRLTQAEVPDGIECVPRSGDPVG